MDDNKMNEYTITSKRQHKWLTTTANSACTGKGRGINEMHVIVSPSLTSNHCDGGREHAQVYR